MAALGTVLWTQGSPAFTAKFIFPGILVSTGAAGSGFAQILKALAVFTLGGIDDGLGFCHLG